MLGGGPYRFGVFEFDAVTLGLRKSGRRVRLRPQALKLLGLFLAHPRELISRADIHQELWASDVFVDFEQGVNHCVKELRAALGDDADTPRYIETLPRRGYRFIAPIEVIAASGEPAPAPQEAAWLPENAASPAAEAAPFVRTAAPAGWRGVLSAPLAWSSVMRAWVLLAVCAMAGAAILALTRDAAPPVDLPGDVRIAVLPLDVLDMPTEMQYLALSLAEAVGTRLSSAGGMRVMPMSAIRDYPGRTTDPGVFARDLDVDYVVTGKLTREDHRHRVDIALVHAWSSRPVWRGTVEDPDLSRLETMIATGVLSRLMRSPPAEGGRGRTESPAAYEAYLQGRFYMARLTGEDTRRAITSFDAALAIDRKYALAHAGVAKASAQMLLRFSPEEELASWEGRAEHHARRALELDGTLAEAHEALAAVARHLHFDWDRTIEQSVEALRLNPSLDLPHYYLASALQHTGHLDLAEAEVASGLETNPLNLTEAFRLRGTTALWAGRFADARAQLERLSELSSRPVADTILAQALYYLGETAKADAMLAGVHGSVQSEQRARAMRASFLAARLDARGALALVSDVLIRGYRDHHVAYSLGATYAGLGRTDEAFHWLREAAASGFLCHPWYMTDPLLHALRADPAFGPFIDGVKEASDRISVDAVRALASQRGAR